MNYRARLEARRGMNVRAGADEPMSAEDVAWCRALFEG